MKTIICLVGLSGSGKSEAAYYYRIAYAAAVQHITESVRATLRLCGTDVTREAVQEAATELFLKDNRVLIRAFISIATSSISPIVICDGLSWRFDLKQLREYFEHITLVAIHAPQELRYLRGVASNEYSGETDMTFEEFVLRESHSYEQEISVLMEQADYRITNDKSLDDFYRQLEDVIKDILTRTKAF